ncbi:LysR family transcriptional regulator [Frankia sp. AgB1.9]|uniref:LysR family transcriptional regulator n=1 Tax=unclassified Frankia TaxID=2632575 RepID=UPI001933F9F2|nr:MULTISPECIES: LysR family transcriptional regulator [unclassified Frankia]MBL7489958.1 LysR family transcriptional regulator [Frankia sp. AgW1.1]MBL7552154.1 LysR family transcriptional regulator [Frankia sp. AgB1.9]MBL7625249.1 LysR family transcriptional regulator [Frankia sp. AgB1.8]
MNEKTAAAALVPELAQLAALGVERSITRAAARSATSQPTLSRAVRRWEDALGVRLVEPHGRGIRLTPEGGLLTAAAGEAFRLMETAVRRARGEAPAPTLTIAFLRSLGPPVVGELVSSFLREHPGVLIAHLEASTAAVLDGIDARQIDLAVTAPHPPGRFGWLHLGDQAIVLMVPATHRLAGRSTVGLREVADEAFLSLDHRFHTRQVTDALWAAADLTPRITMEADDLRTIANYVSAGLGLALVPADSAAHPRTVNLPLAEAGARREFGLAWRAADDRPLTRSFVDHARELNERYPGWADIDL